MVKELPKGGFPLVEWGEQGWKVHILLLMTCQNAMFFLKNIEDLMLCTSCALTLTVLWSPSQAAMYVSLTTALYQRDGVYTNNFTHALCGPKRWLHIWQYCSILLKGTSELWQSKETLFTLTKQRNIPSLSLFTKSLERTHEFFEIKIGMNESYILDKKSWYKEKVQEDISLNISPRMGRRATHWSSWKMPRSKGGTAMQQVPINSNCKISYGKSEQVRFPQIKTTWWRG